MRVPKFSRLNLRDVINETPTTLIHSDFQEEWLNINNDCSPQHTFPLEGSVKEKKKLHDKSIVYTMHHLGPNDVFRNVKVLKIARSFWSQLFESVVANTCIQSYLMFNI